MNIVLLVIGWILFPAGLIAFIVGKVIPNEGEYGDNYTTAKKVTKKLGIIAAIIGIPLVILGSSFSIIPTGKVGVVYQFGVLQEGKVMGTGLQWKTPFVQSIKEVNIMQQNSNEVSEEGAQIWGESKNKLPVYARDIRITYQISTEGVNYLLKNVTDMNELSTFGKTVQSAFSASTIEFDDVDVCKQSLVEPVMLKEMQRITDAKYGAGNVIIVRVLIGELDYEQAYQDAITARKNAEQAAEQQKVENQKAIDKASADAEAQKIKADGDAAALLISADAQAQANKRIAESLSAMIIAEKWIVKWDGKMPVVTDGSGNIIDISAIIKGLE